MEIIISFLTNNIQLIEGLLVIGLLDLFLVFMMLFYKGCDALVKQISEEPRRKAKEREKLISDVKNAIKEDNQ